MNRLLLIVPAAAVCFLVANPRAPAESNGEVPIGGILPEVSLNGLNGPSRKLGSYRGTPLVINVWASWCGPCRLEMASLERLAWRDPRANFVIIGISTDDDANRANSLLKESNATISHFIDHQLILENLLGASRLPLTVLVDGKGRVVNRIVGAKQWDSDEALRLIAAAFAKP